MDVNITRERKVTNVRQSTGEEFERLVPPRLLSLEQALEFCADDECVEVTIPAVRLRKTVLVARERFRERARVSGETEGPASRGPRQTPAGPLLVAVLTQPVQDLVGTIRGDPDHGPHRVGQRHPRHAERDRGLVGPPGQLPVQLRAQVQGYRTGLDRIALLPAGSASGSARRAAAAAICALRSSRSFCAVMTGPRRAGRSAR